MPETVTAAVLRALSAPFTLETVTLREPAAGEVLVTLAATGICHTDIKVSRGYADVSLPVVLGHEGAGVVAAVGEGVTGVAPGDHVVLSFPYCGHCQPCRDHHPAYCDNGQALSFACEGAGYGGVHGHFFGQSSFAGAALAGENNLVKVAPDLPLEALGPLGCGFQTGAGAILNVLQPAAGTSLAVFGAGNVGLSAVMAAAIAGMDPIVVVDVNPERLALAQSLGATHGVDQGLDGDPVATIRQLTGGGANYTLDTTNLPVVVRQAFEALANRGTCVHSGGGGKDICVPGGYLLHGRTLTGVIQGDSVPQAFIPQLLDYHRSGRFPFDRLLTFYPLVDINRAVTDMEAGRVVKPVLRMD